jgi:hypothetical protein
VAALPKLFSANFITPHRMPLGYMELALCRPDRIRLGLVGRIDNCILSAHSAEYNKRTLKKEKSKRGTLELTTEDMLAPTEGNR